MRGGSIVLEMRCRGEGAVRVSKSRHHPKKGGLQGALHNPLWADRVMAEVGECGALLARQATAHEGQRKAQEGSVRGPPTQQPEQASSPKILLVCYTSSVTHDM